MRGTLYVLVVAAAGCVAALVLAASPAAPAASRDDRCATPRGAKTLLRSSRARVYRRRGRTYVCPKSTGRRIWLEDLSADDSFPGIQRARHLRLAEWYFAYAYEVGREEVDMLIRLYDLRSGKRVQELVAEQQDAAYQPNAMYGVTDLVLSRGGTLGWIVRNPRSAPQRTEVHKRDTSGRALLEGRQEVEPGSLALGGNRLYWTSGGQPRSATLGQ